MVFSLNDEITGRYNLRNKMEKKFDFNTKMDLKSQSFDVLFY